MQCSKQLISDILVGLTYQVSFPVVTMVVLHDSGNGKLTSKINKVGWFYSDTSYNLCQKFILHEETSKAYLS